MCKHAPQIFDHKIPFRFHYLQTESTRMESRRYLNMKMMFLNQRQLMGCHKLSHIIKRSASFSTYFAHIFKINNKSHFLSPKAIENLRYLNSNVLSQNLTFPVKFLPFCLMKITSDIFFA